MKSKASSQTTDTVVAEWQTVCETDGLAMMPRHSMNRVDIESHLSQMNLASANHSNKDQSP